MFARALFGAVIAGLSLVGSGGASSAATPPPSPSASSGAAFERARDGGVIEGKITSIDYQRNVMTVNKTDIRLMPSTQIQGHDPGYHAFTDLKAGMSVEVYTSQVAGKYIAQIITLK